jgi:hypothetical protein
MVNTIITTTLASILPPATATSISVPSTPAHPPYQYISRSTWTFTQGFLLGQIVIIVLCGVFLKYVVFEEGDKQDVGSRKAGSRGEVSVEMKRSVVGVVVAKRLLFDQNRKADPL